MRPWAWMDDRLGNFNVGKEADFVVLDLNATTLQQLRQSRAKNIEDTFCTDHAGMTVILQQLMSMDRLSMSKPNKSRQRRIILTAIVAVCAFALKRFTAARKLITFTASKTGASQARMY